MNCMKTSEAVSAAKPRLSQLRHLDLLARLLQDYPTADTRRLGNLTRDGLLSWAACWASSCPGAGDRDP